MSEVWDGQDLPSKSYYDCEADPVEIMDGLRRIADWRSEALSDRTEASTGALALSPEGDIGAIRKLHPDQGFGYWSYTGNAYPDGAPIADSWRVVWTP